MNNWFLIAVGLLQQGAAIQYAVQGKPKMFVLMTLYALTNVVLFWMEGE